MACLYTFPWQVALSWLTPSLPSRQAVSFACPSPRANLILKYFAWASKWNLLIECFQFSNKNASVQTSEHLQAQLPAPASRSEHLVNWNHLELLLPVCLWFTICAMILHSVCPLQSPGKLKKNKDTNCTPDLVNRILGRADESLRTPHLLPLRSVHLNWPLRQAFTTSQSAN